MIRALAVLLLLPALASASCGYSYSYPSYYYKPVYKPYYIPVAKYFDVPLYSAAYVPPIGTTTTTQTTTQTTTAATTAVTAAAGAASATDQRAIREDQFRATVVGELRAMRSRLDRTEQALRGVLPPPPSHMPKTNGDGKAPATSKAPTMAEGLVILQNKCAACHRADVAERKGASFAMFSADGSPMQLSAAQMVSVIRMIDTSKMPKMPNQEGITALTDAEATAITAYLHGQDLQKAPAPPAKEPSGALGTVPNHIQYINATPASGGVRQRRIQR